MPENVSQLRIDGLTPLQLAELQTAVASTDGDYVEINNPGLGGGKVGEPTLLSVAITLGPLAVSAVALWISKQKKGRTKSLKYSKIAPNGVTESFEMDETSYDEGAAQSTAVQIFLEKVLADGTSIQG